MRDDETTYPFWLGDLDDDKLCRIGLSEIFLEKLEGDPVGVELSSPGSKLQAGDGLGFLYLPQKAVDVRAPFAMEIVRHNPEIFANPALAKLASYGRGWLTIIRIV